MDNYEYGIVGPITPASAYTFPIGLAWVTSAGVQTVRGGDASALSQNDGLADTLVRLAREGWRLMGYRASSQSTRYLYFRRRRSQ